MKARSLPKIYFVNAWRSLAFGAIILTVLGTSAKADICGGDWCTGQIPDGLTAVAAGIYIGPATVDTTLTPPGFAAILSEQNWVDGLGQIRGNKVILEGFVPLDFVQQGNFSFGSAPFAAWPSIPSILYPFSDVFGPLTPLAWPTSPLNLPAKPPLLTEFFATASDDLSQLSDFLSNPAFEGICAAIEPCTYLTGLLLTASAGFALLAADPADINFMTVALQLSGPTFPPINASALSVTQTNALADFEATLSDIYTLPNAIQDSWNRAQGALSVNNRVWEAVQLFAFVGYSQMAQEDFSRISADAATLGLMTSITYPIPEPSSLVLLFSACLSLLIIRAPYQPHYIRL
jgi:hypothetical protein